jgi:sugar O-acyltransferase (sialic acid O-acetyltransferase NeuD family)
MWEAFASSLMKTYIVGNGGFAAEVLEWLMAAQNDCEFMGFVVASGSSIGGGLYGHMCIEENKLPANEEIVVYFAIGSPPARRRVAERIKSQYSLAIFPNLFHPTAIISDKAQLGNGNLFMPYSIVCPGASIGSFNILNIYASLGHDAELQSYCTLSPYATLNGCASCADEVFIGSHATVAPGVRIEKLATLSANSLATKLVSEGSLAFGVPAKFLKKRQGGLLND